MAAVPGAQVLILGMRSGPVAELVPGRRRASRRRGETRCYRYFDVPAPRDRSGAPNSGFSDRRGDDASDSTAPISPPQLATRSQRRAETHQRRSRRERGGGVHHQLVVHHPTATPAALSAARLRQDHGDRLAGRRRRRRHRQAPRFLLKLRTAWKCHKLCPVGPSISLDGAFFMRRPRRFVVGATDHARSAPLRSASISPTPLDASPPISRCPRDRRIG